MTIKKIIIIIILILSMIFLSGCYDANSVETLAYAVAIGIDKVQDNVIKLTIQFAVPKTSDSSSGSSQSSSSTIIDVNCSTIDEGLSLINSYISKKINLSHCKAIVFSEEIAYEGISQYILNLVNNVQVRPDCNLIVCRCDAYQFLSNSIPTLESVPARYYELIFSSSKYTGYTDSVCISSFYEKMQSSTCEPIAVLGGVNAASTQEASSASNSIGDGYRADETPLETQNNIENLGLAVFSGDSLVGELNSIETLCHMIVSNKLKNATITIPNPNNYGNSISLSINLEKPTKNKVRIINDYPLITSTIWISGYILNLDDSIDMTNTNTVQEVNSAANAYLNYYILSYLYKTAKEYHSDIDNFGSHLLINYPTTNSWEKADWLNNYKNSFFEVIVKCNIVSANLFNKF